MKLTYYADTDSLYVEFVDRPSLTCTEIAAGVVADLDGQGRVVGIDVDNARNKIDLDRIVISNVPALIEVDRRNGRIDDGLPEPLPADVTLPVPREHLEILKARLESPATWLDWEEVKESPRSLTDDVNHGIQQIEDGDTIPFDLEAMKNALRDDLRRSGVTAHMPTSDADMETAIQSELPWLLDRAKARDAAASEDTVSGRLRRAVTAMRQPYEHVSQATGIPFQDLADFMAGGQLPSDALDRLATAAHCELVARGSAT